MSQINDIRTLADFEPIGGIRVPHSFINSIEHQLEHHQKYFESGQLRTSYDVFGAEFLDSLSNAQYKMLPLCVEHLIKQGRGYGLFISDDKSES